MRRFGFFLALAGAILAQGAFATEEGGVLLNAVAFKPLPPGMRIAVRPLDNSDDNLIIKKDFERQLQAKGYQVSSDAVLVLSFETREEVGAWSDSGRRTLLELEGRNATGDNETAKARVNLFDSNAGGVFNEGRGGISTVTPSLVRLEVTIDSRADGKRFWQGWSIADQGQGDSLATTRAMVPTMVVNLGQTVRSQRFALP